MTLCPRTAFRAAALVSQQLVLRRRSHGDVFLPDHIWERVNAHKCSLDRARGLGWLGAARRLRQDLAYELGHLRGQIEHVMEVLDRQTELLPIPSQAEVFREIQALPEEFQEVRIDLKLGHLSVVTERIELDEIDLGPFEIRLELKLLNSTPCYRAVALDANPAADDESITHPHVQDEHLCEGEGHEAIQVALAEGRLADFFLIVSRLLTTYHRGHAYKELRDWVGVPCSECGATTSQSHAASCTGCESTVCDDCGTYCRGCDSTYCADCLTACAACDELYCNNCIGKCDACHKPVCTRCLAGGLCRPCRNQRLQTQETCHAPSAHNTAASTAA